MKKHRIRGLLSTMALAGAFLFIGVSSTSAAPASPEKGPGCFVGDANGNYVFDASCQTHLVTKLDAAGNLVLFEYQDMGRLPDGAALPTSAIRNVFEQCFNSSFGVICGITDETITPSGIYKSSFTLN
jgi:hypothetical protein